MSGQGNSTSSNGQGTGTANPGPVVSAPPAPVPPPTGMTWEQIQVVIAMMNESRPRTEKKYDVDTKDPEAFNGDTKKARAFLEDCQLQFAINPHKFQDSNGALDGRLMIGYVLSFCNKGVAHDFAQLQFQKYKEKGLWDSWPEFEEVFRAQFITIDEQGEALLELTTMHMTNNDCDGYVGRFKLLAKRAGITEEAMLMYHFQRGLNPGLYNWLMNLGELPKKFDELCEKVQKKNALFKQMTEGKPEWHKGNRGGNRSTSQGNRNWQWRPQQQQQQTYRPPQQRNEYQGEPMDIDAFSAEQQKLFREGKCFECRKQGHIARNCPDKKAKGNRFGSNNPFRRQIAETTSEPPKDEAAKPDQKDVLIQAMMTQMKEMQEEMRKMKEDF